MRKWSIKWFNEYYHEAKIQHGDKTFMRTLRKMKRAIKHASDRDMQNYVVHMHNYISSLLLQDPTKLSDMTNIIYGALTIGEKAVLAAKRMGIPFDDDEDDEDNPMNTIMEFFNSMNSGQSNYNDNEEDDDDDEQKEPAFIGSISSGNMNGGFSIGNIIRGSNNISIPSVPQIKSKVSHKISWICNEPMMFTIEKNGQLWFNNECWDYLFRSMYSEAYMGAPIVEQERLMNELRPNIKTIKLNLGFYANNKKIMICFDKGATNVKSIEFVTKYDTMKKPFGVMDLDKAGTMYFYIDDKLCGDYLLEPSGIPGCLHGTLINADEPSTKNIVTIK